MEMGGPIWVMCRVGYYRQMGGLREGNITYTGGPRIQGRNSALALGAGLVTHNMRNDDHQVPSPEAQVPRSRSRDLGLSEHFGDYRVLTPKFWLPGLRVASTWESGVGTWDSVISNMFTFQK
ncbi:hypothetical protein F4604DRAFT_1685898 [Suillus subluteus]|nr:hypothetical protein F4604DRAFT_1685898 [Suillus subluteus]